MPRDVECAMQLNSYTDRVTFNDKTCIPVWSAVVCVKGVSLLGVSLEKKLMLSL